MKKTILCFFGTRPEAIKMAPVVKSLQADGHFRVVVAVSAQHRDMLDQVLKLFHISCGVDLNLMREGQSLFDVTTKVLAKMNPVLDRVRPDLVLVHGDTTTTMAGALAAFYKKIPVGHVEAGLRTRDKYRPFPEEVNRRVTDSVASLFFAPTQESRRHLLKESIPDKEIFVTGNTVIDSLLAVARRTYPTKSAPLKTVLKKIGPNPYVLVTAHRRENFGQPFKEIFFAFLNLARKFPHLHWIYPVHPNPNVSRLAKRILAGRSNFHLISPLNYSDLVQVMKGCLLVVTDSGGLQEEAPSLGKPVLVLREVTERPEAIRAGTVKLVGTNGRKIISEVTRLVTNRTAYRKMANAVNPYGDGRAAERILQAIRWNFGMSTKRPRPFGRKR